MEGADISREALRVAEENNRRLSGRVAFRQSDLFGAFEEQERYDVITSNPPYIPSAVIEGLEPEVKDYEPRLALDGSADGLEFYRRLAEECPGHLNPGGKSLIWRSDMTRGRQ